jgi:hypothetical protein
MASMKPQEYTAFTLDYLFHNYKYIKRKLTALEMRKVAQRRIAERLVAMGLESKGLDGLLEDDGSTIPVDQPLMTPRGITLMLTSEKTTILGMRDSATDAEQSKGADTERAAGAAGAAMAQRPDLDEGVSERGWVMGLRWGDGRREGVVTKPAMSQMPDLDEGVVGNGGWGRGDVVDGAYGEERGLSGGRCIE